MGKKTLALVVLALATPAVALAAKPLHPTSQSKAAPKVMYVLKGTLWNYTAASSTADGSITIHVTHSNYHGRTLRNTDLTFVVSTKTTTTLNGATTISNGALGTVKFRAFKNMTNTGLMAALSPNHMTAFQVIDKGMPRSDMLVPPTR
jgi:hypothetical protein